MINTYLDVIEELQYVNTLKKENDVKTYSDDIKMYEKKLEDLQKKYYIYNLIVLQILMKII